MPISEAVLYDQFTRARMEAVKLTDRYRDAPSDAPYRDELWEQVVNQTETARSLLECFLDEPHQATNHRQGLEQDKFKLPAGRRWS
jgi:hypothetical protein